MAERSLDGNPASPSVPVRVDKTAFCRFDTNHYSVGPEHVGKTLTLAADDHEVRIIEGISLIARHERCWGSS